MLILFPLRWHKCSQLCLSCVFLESKYGVETKTIAADFASTDIYPNIEKGLAGLEIGVLGKCFNVYSIYMQLTQCTKDE